MAKRDLLERFFEKFSKAGDDECWIWQGAKAGHGYGQIWNEGRLVKAHRLSWEIHHGKTFPEGMQGCHSCDVPSCVNPRHIWPGTMKDNLQDASRKGRTFRPTAENFVNGNKRKTHCKRGHPFFGENLYLLPSGSRGCRICRKDDSLARRPEMNAKRNERRKAAKAIRALQTPANGGQDGK